MHSFGSELGMEDYIRARSDVFFTGPDGSPRRNRAFCQAAGHYACDLFIRSALQIDLDDAVAPFSTIAPLAVMAGTHVSSVRKSISVIHSLSDRF